MLRLRIKNLWVIVAALSLASCVLYRDVDEVTFSQDGSDGGVDGDAASCEADLQTDRDNCGSCGSMCGEGEICAAGACASVVDLSVGSTFACVALRVASGQQRAGDEVWCWGESEQGQLGDAADGVSFPVRLSRPDFPGLQDEVELYDLDAGPSHVCAIWAETVSPNTALVHCWGANASFALGNCTDPDVTEAIVELEAAPGDLDDREVYQVSAGGRHTCVMEAVRGAQSAALKCWGADELGQSGGQADGDQNTICSDNAARPLSDVQQEVFDIAAGTSHTCAAASREVVCWGQSLEDPGSAYDTPVRYTLEDLGAPSEHVVLDVTSGNEFSCFVRGEPSIGGGVIGCFGSDLSSAEGTLTFDESENAEFNEQGRDFTNVWAGYNTNAYAVDTSNAPFALGRNKEAWTLGAGAQGARFEMMDVGDDFSCGILLDENARVPVCWGSASDERLGSPGGSTGTPRPVEFREGGG
jgi:alpha-tubulin suppressor-like RCC1 family protein